MREKSYEVPEVLPGDLIECLKTGGQGIVREHSVSSSGHPDSWSVEPVPGARIKCAWWKRDEFKVVEKGPAHKVWAAALLVKKEQDERRSLESDIDWVIANWDDIQADLSLTSVSAVLKAARLLPDQIGLLSRGEIGIAALQLFDIYRRFEGDIAEAMTSEDPKKALLALGVLAKIR